MMTTTTTAATSSAGTPPPPVTTTRVLVQAELLLVQGSNIQFEVVVCHESFEDLLQATVGCMALVHRYKLGWVPVSAEFWPVATTAAMTSIASITDLALRDDNIVEEGHNQHSPTQKGGIFKVGVACSEAYKELRARGPRSYYLQAKIVCSRLPGQVPPHSDDLLSFSRALFLKMCIAMPTSWLLLPAAHAAAAVDVSDVSDVSDVVIDVAADAPAAVFAVEEVVDVVADAICRIDINNAML